MFAQEAFTLKLRAVEWRFVSMQEAMHIQLHGHWPDFEFLRKSARGPAVAKRAPAFSGVRLSLPDWSLSIPKFRFRLGRAAGLFAFATIAVTAPFVVVAIAAHANLATVSAKYAALRRSAEALEWQDANGQIVAMKPRSALQESGMLTLPSEHIPDDFYEMYRTKENRRSALPWRNWYGLDMQSIAVSIVCKTSKWISGKPENCRGASTLEMQAARAWQGGYGGKSNGSLSVQASYAVDAMSLSLVHTPDSQEYRKLVLDGLTFGTAPGGQELYGPRLASLITFGLEPKDLTRAQKAVIAAMALYRIPWSCDDNFIPQGAQLTEQNQIKNRAIEMVQQTFPNATDTAQVVNEIRHIRLPTRPAPLPAELTVGMTNRAACMAASNPGTRPYLPTNMAMAGARAELMATDIGPAKRIALTLDGSRQAEFANMVGAIVDRIAEAPAARRFWAKSAGNSGPDVLAVTVSNGRITQLFTSTQRNILDERRSVGSIGKLVILAAAASQGYSTEDMLCRKRDRQTGLTEVGGFAGYENCGGAADVSFEGAFARSENLALLDLARNLDQTRLRNLAISAGFELPEDSELPYALVTGMVRSTPRNLLAFEQALANAAAGKAPRAVLPYLVDKVEKDNGWLALKRQHMDLSEFLSAGQGTELLREAGGAAIRNPRGTLAAIASDLPPAVGELAKSGTVAGSRPALNTRIKQAIGAVPNGISWLVALGSETGFVGDRNFSMIALPKKVRENAIGSIR
jgi:hypothetical protein